MLHAHWHTFKNGEHPKANSETHNLIQFGKVLAKEVGRDEPFSESSLSRFLNGKQPSDEIAKAFSIFFELPSSMIAARHVEEVEWFRIGRMLRVANRPDFQQLLGKLQAFAVAEKEKANATRNVDQVLGIEDQSSMLTTEHAPSDD